MTPQGAFAPYSTSLLATGKQLVREADGDVGKRGWRKRKPLGNRADKD